MPADVSTARKKISSLPGGGLNTELNLLARAFPILYDCLTPTEVSSSFVKFWNQSSAMSLLEGGVDPTKDNSIKNSVVWQTADPISKTEPRSTLSMREAEPILQSLPVCVNLHLGAIHVKWGLGFGVWGLGFGVWEIGRASCRERV